MATLAASPPGVSTGPGVMVLTRIERPASSVAQVRARLRIAALVAPYTLRPGAPRRAALEESRITEAPSGRSGSAFWTVKTVPLTLTSDV
jgi:hypothetical protein